MAGIDKYEVLIIGGGQAGIPLARDLAGMGKRVALAERKDMGGSCINFGCTPTKAAIASAKVAHLARRGAAFGLNIPTVDVDFLRVLQRARNISIEFRRGLDKRVDGTENLRLFRSHVRFEGRERDGFRVRLGAEVVIADEVVIDTGTRSRIPGIEGLAEVQFIHTGNWLAMATLPAHLAMIGGGAIGLEMAQFFRRMGSRVTVIEGGDQVAGHEDADIGNALKTVLEGEGIEIRLKTSVTRIEAHDGDLRLTLKGTGAASIEASHVFVATGRRPNTDDLELEKVGVAVSAHGIINADERLSTNVRGIWAAGDIRGGPQFTHTAWDDYRVLMSQIAGDGTRTTRRIVPYAIFTDPELGRTGMTETEALRAGHRVKVGRFDMKDSPKAIEIGQTEGFIKVVIDAETGLILGAAVLAAEGGEIVHCYVDLMNARSPYTVLRDAIHIHPTLCEAIQSAVSAIH